MGWTYAIIVPATWQNNIELLNLQQYDQHGAPFGFPALVNNQRAGLMICHVAGATIDGGSNKNFGNIIQSVKFVNEKIYLSHSLLFPVCFSIR